MTASRLLVVLLALAPAALAGDKARSPHGVEVDVPAGFRWREGFKTSPTTVIYLESTEAGPFPATILVNHSVATGNAKEEDIFTEFRGLARAPEDAAVVDLSGGRFQRVDFDVPMRSPPRTVRQRAYVVLRGHHIYCFFLANLEAQRLAPLLPAFDALVAGARFFDPVPTPPAGGTAPVASITPVQGAPAAPVAAKPAPASTAPVTSPAAPVAARPPAPAPAVAPPLASTGPVASPTVAAKPPAPAPAAPSPAAPSPVAGKPPAPPRPPVNLLSRAKLLSSDSEYDPDIWAAAHLIDGRAETGWCSAPRAKPPFRFVVDLQAPARIERLVVDAACPEEPGYEGVAASAVVVEASTTGPDAGFAPLVEAKVEAGKNDQSFALERPVEARWLRLTIPGNHGHATLTELMDVRAYGRSVEAAPPPAAVTPPTPRALRLAEARASREKNGDKVGEGEGFAPGSRVWLNLRPRDLAVGKDGKTWLEVDLVLEDTEGRELLRRDKVVDNVAPPPLPPLAPFVALHLDLPAGFPPGRYLALLYARDKVAQTSAAATCEFTVTAP